MINNIEEANSFLLHNLIPSILNTDLNDLPVNSLKNSKINELNNYIENTFNLCSKDISIIRETWWLQRELAYKYLNNPTEEVVETLSFLMVDEDIDLTTLANKIINQSNMLSKLVCIILGFYRRAVKDIEKEESKDMLDTHVNTFKIKVSSFIRENGFNY